MSRLPCEQQRIKPPNGGGEYKVLPAYCARPGCERSAVHGHHALPRSYTISWPTQDWALLDGNLVPVVIPLCWEHHEQCTDNTARIAWEHRWYWEGLGRGKKTQDGRDLWLIDHPKVWPALGDAGGMGSDSPPAPSDPTEQSFLRSSEPSPPVSPNADRCPATVTVNDQPSQCIHVTGHDGDHFYSPNAELQPGESCPVCGKRVPHEKKPDSPTSKSVGFRVPLEAVEDYKEHLRMWKEALGVAGEPFADYKAALTAFGYCTQNAVEIKAEIERRLA